MFHINNTPVVFCLLLFLCFTTQGSVPPAGAPYARPWTRRRRRRGRRGERSPTPRRPPRWCCGDLGCGLQISQSRLSSQAFPFDLSLLRVRKYIDRTPSMWSKRRHHTAGARVIAGRIRAGQSTAQSCFLTEAIFTEESWPRWGFIPAETLVLNGTAGDNGTAGGILNQPVLGFLTV